MNSSPFDELPGDNSRQPEQTVGKNQSPLDERIDSAAPPPVYTETAELPSRRPEVSIADLSVDGDRHQPAQTSQGRYGASFNQPATPSQLPASQHDPMYQPSRKDTTSFGYGSSSDPSPGHLPRAPTQRERPNILERLDPRKKFGDVRPATTQNPRRDAEHVYIAVMGVTGSGKSTFVQQCSSINVKIGHSLESCTAQVEDFQFMFNESIRVHLIDTPGFDDTHKSDTDILRDIASWLGTTYKQGIQLSGIIYMHRIIDPRMTGGAMRNLGMFKKLCGSDCFGSLLFATTFWHLATPEDGERREVDLVGNNGFWADMLNRGAEYRRHTGDRHSAMNILHYMISHRRRFTTKIQREMVDEEMELNETGAGQQLNKDLIEMQERHKKQMADLKIAMQAAVEERDKEAMEQLKQMEGKLKREIDQAKDAQKNLVADLEKINKERDEELKRHQESLNEKMTELTELKKLIDEYRDGSEESAQEQRVYRAQVEELQGELEAMKRRQPSLLERVGHWLESKLDVIEIFLSNI